MEHIIEILNGIDSDVFLFFNGFHAPFWDAFMYLFSGRFIWAPMYAAVLFMLYRSYNWKTASVYFIAIILTIVIADQGCASWIRPHAERLRPSNLENPLSLLTHVVNGYRGGSYGFPSCHAANSLALAVFTSLMVGRRRFTLFILGWAFMNCYTRVYLGVHYPGDLLVGALIGSAAGAIMYCCARLIASALASPHGDFSERGVSLGVLKIRFRDTAVVMAVGFATVAYIIVVSLISLWI